MELVDKETLCKCRLRLCEDMQIIKVVAKLESHGIITDIDRQLIKAEKTEFEKKEKFLDILKTKGREAFSCFIAALSETKQLHLVTCLLDCRQEIGLEERVSKNEENACSVSVRNRMISAGSHKIQLKNEDTVMTRKCDATTSTKDIDPNIMENTSLRLIELFLKLLREKLTILFYCLFFLTICVIVFGDSILCIKGLQYSSPEDPPLVVVAHSLNIPKGTSSLSPSSDFQENGAIMGQALFSYASWTKDSLLQITVVPFDLIKYSAMLTGRQVIKHKFDQAVDTKIRPKCMFGAMGTTEGWFAFCCLYYRNLNSHQNSSIECKHGEKKYLWPDNAYYDDIHVTFSYTENFLHLSALREDGFVCLSGNGDPFRCFEFPWEEVQAWNWKWFAVMLKQHAAHHHLLIPTNTANSDEKRPDFSEIASFARGFLRRSNIVSDHSNVGLGMGTIEFKNGPVFYAVRITNTTVHFTVVTKNTVTPRTPEIKTDKTRQLLPNAKRSYALISGNQVFITQFDSNKRMIGIRRFDLFWTEN